MGKLPLGGAAKPFWMRGVRFEQILKGESNKKLLVVGPCSIHDPEAALEYCEVAESCRGQMRQAADLSCVRTLKSPRTTVGWKGFINDPRHNGTFEMKKAHASAQNYWLSSIRWACRQPRRRWDPITIQYFADPSHGRQLAHARLNLRRTVKWLRPLHARRPSRTQRTEYRCRCKCDQGLAGATHVHRHGRERPDLHCINHR